MKVGFLGVQCDNPNLGVMALAYSIVGIVDRLVPEEAEFTLFSAASATELDRMATALGLVDKRLTATPIRHRDPRALAHCIRALRECRVVIDLTGGDSFSDIYGVRRLLLKLFDKQLVLLSGRPLVIAPQTIGPFRQRATLPWVRHVINRAALVFTRDRTSRDLLAGLSRREVLVATDVAVTLPQDDRAFPFPASPRARVAFNASGLLWNGGYTGDNQFGLRTDYRAYCDLALRRLLDAGHEVHLLPHVLARGGAIAEDDANACRELQQAHPECILAPVFHSPVEAKSYIARMDAFIGARMHATIAALTTNVPTIPVAYSRKFSGFYNNLGYDSIVDLVALDTQAAVDLTLALVGRRETLRPAVTAANNIAQEEIRVFTDSLASLLEDGARARSA